MNICVHDTSPFPSGVLEHDTQNENKIDERHSNLHFQLKLFKEEKPTRTLFLIDPAQSHWEEMFLKPHSMLFWALQEYEHRKTKELLLA